MPPTDLLDMFKPRPTRGSSPARATSRPRESGAGGAIGPKKLWLAGTVVVLLMALAFTAGVGVGRSRRVTSEAPALAAPVKPPVDHWGIRSKTLPSVGAKADSLKVRMFEDLIRRWPELSGHVYVVDAYDKNQQVKQGQFRLVVKDFQSREDAKSVATDLWVWSLDGLIPFEGCRPERME